MLRKHPDPFRISFFYNCFMARGWESKAIEAQQAEVSEKTTTLRTKMTPQQAARKRHIEGLMLSRQRVRQQLAAARDPRHRHLLEGALADLDRRLHDLQAD
jgi:hypothetical protein